MSEYQYHEWQTVDRLLTPAEQAECDDVFFSRVRQLAEKFAARSSLIRRWREKGWI